MTAVEAAWVAGLFEGEGCVYRNSNGRSIGVALGMTDEDVVRKLATIVGTGNVYVQHDKRGGKPMYRWSRHGQVFVATLFRQIEPHLGQRRRDKFHEVLA